jgi:hypothetical protein
MKDYSKSSTSMEQNTNLEARPKLDVEKLSSPSKLYYMPEEAMDLKLDLVKAYDTADHKLLIKVLEKYGVPPTIRRIVAIFYENLVISLTIGSEKVELRQSVGVRKGDNMAPVLFLFIMTAFYDLLEIEYVEQNIERIGFATESEDTYRNGQIHRHDMRKLYWTVLNRKLGCDCEDNARVVEGASGHCNGSVWRDLMATV